MKEEALIVEMKRIHKCHCLSLSFNYNNRGNVILVGITESLEKHHKHSNTHTYMKINVV